MPTTALHAADVADNLARLTESALADARIAQRHLERLEHLLREVGTQLEEIEDDCDAIDYPFVLVKLGRSFLRQGDDVAGLLNTDGTPAIIIRDVGELLEMLQLGASQLRRAAGKTGEVAEVAR